jgi:excisionase family DNA binding protein
MYLTYPKASEHLAAMGVPLAENTLRRMVSQKRIPFLKLSKRVLFDTDSLSAWLKSRSVEPRK